MKTLLLPALVSIIFIGACRKSSPGGNGNPANASLINSWQLLRVDATVGLNSFVETPSADSAVLLTFKSDGSYASYLNGQLVSQGSFSTSPDSSEPGWSLLEMNNFQTTGLVEAWNLYEDTGAGPLVLIDNQMAVNVSQDTLYMTPGFVSYGGWDVYVFLKE
jgi:hypothetical protein